MKLGPQGDLDAGMRTVLVDREGAVLIVTINRMEKYNAIDARMRGELAHAFDLPKGDRGIRAVVLWGGSKGFMGGADIGELRDRRPLDMFSPMSASADAWDIVARCPVPVVAAVAGLALGGGNELALACDLRIAADNAVFGQTEVNIGLVPGRGGTQRLPRAVNGSRASEMVLTGATIKAEEALRLGLVNRVVPAQRLLEEAVQLASSIAEKSPIAVRLAKLVLDAGQDMGLEAALLMESFAFAMLFSTDDMREGVGAFLEKRAPRYLGQ